MGVWRNADAARVTQIDGATSSDGTGTLKLDYVLTSHRLWPEFSRAVEDRKSLQVRPTEGISTPKTKFPEEHQRT
jgi:site-specific recombinase XerC